MRVAKKILITGATGFIGYFLVEEAIKRNYNIFVLVRKSTNRNQLQKKSLSIVEVDFTNIKDLHQKISDLPQFDYIIHNAGLTRAVRTREFYETNYQNTVNLLSVLKDKNNIRGKFLFVSSLAACGPEEDGLQISNEIIPNPLSAYGKSKLAAEQYILNNSAIPYLIFRCTAVYGPGDRDFFQNIKLLNKGFNINIGSNAQMLTFIHVKDLAQLFFDALESPFKNKIYNVADGKCYSRTDLGHSISIPLNRKVRHVTVPVWVAKIVAGLTQIIARFSNKPSLLRADKISEMSAGNWLCDTGPLVTDFNFKPQYNLENGMKNTINWYLKNKWLEK